MKQTIFLVLLPLTLIVSSTAYSQITGLDREQKIQIVSGLESYGAILIEVDLTQQLLGQCNEINRLLEEQLKTKDEIIDNLKKQIEGYQKEVNIQDDEIRKQRKKNLVTVAGGAGLLILSLILK